tara:strand:- start:815 stop:943 length:129 start_codon:yes stop_codon:yes gene_type:complete
MIEKVSNKEIFDLFQLLGQYINDKEKMIEIIDNFKKEKCLYD